MRLPIQTINQIEESKYEPDLEGLLTQIKAENTLIDNLIGQLISMFENKPNIAMMLQKLARNISNLQNMIK